ncbi:MAG: glycosyltransferase family A protein [Bacteroidota bacterium]
MLTFVVPVKSERVSANWSKFCALYERTLTSICNQTDENFKVVVVCHERPQIDFSHKNIHYLEVDFDPPIRGESESDESINKRRELDKGKKLQLGAAYAKDNFNTDYIMTVDSDDFVSDRIAEFVNNNHENRPGWYIKKGYIYFEGNFFLFKSQKFSYLCGSSVIVKPELFKYFFGLDPILYFDHRLTVLNEDIVLDVLPFYGGIYSMANGENHLMNFSNIKKFNTHKDLMTAEGMKRIGAKIKNYSFKFITKKIKREFSFKI